MVSSPQPPIIDNPEATQLHQQLARRLQSTPEGLTRDEIAVLLGVSDRRARKIIEDLRRWAVLPILSPLTTGNKYRMARATPEDMEALNKELRTLSSYGISALESAKGMKTSYQQLYNAGSLFLADVPDAEAVA